MIKKRVCIGNQVSVQKLVEEMSTFSQKAVEYAIRTLVQNGDFKEKNNRKVLHREK